jgi:hypothetical protein
MSYYPVVFLFFFCSFCLLFLFCYIAFLGTACTRAVLIYAEFKKKVETLAVGSKTQGPFNEHKLDLSKTQGPLVTCTNIFVIDIV